MSLFRSKKSFLGLLFFSFFFIISVAWIAQERAKVKPFWVDEDQEVVISCDQSILSMFTKGVRNQDSAPPLYFALQKLVIGTFDHFDETILVKFRYVSIGFACLTFLVIFVFGFQSLGLWGALVAAIVLFQRFIFHHYAAENRAYMAWVFASMLMLLFTLRLSIKKTKEITYFDLIGIFTCGLILCLISTPAFVQAMVFWFSLIFIWILRYENLKTIPKKIWFTFLASFVTLFSFGLNFTLVSAKASYHISKPGATLGWRDLRATHDLALVQDVLALFIGFEGLHNVLWSVLIFIGLGITFFHKPWNKTQTEARSISTTHKNSFFSSKQVLAAENAMIIILFQFFAFIFIAASVYYFRYYFIQRVFIFLITLRSIAAAAGAILLIYFLIQRFQFLKKNQINFKKLSYALLFLLSLFSVFHTYKALQGYRKEFAQTANQTKEPEPCFEVMTEKMVPYTSKITQDYFTPNVVVDIARKLRRCDYANIQKTDEKKETAILREVKDGRDLNYQTIKTYTLPTGEVPEPNEWIPMSFCGKKVVFEPKNFK